MTSTSEKFLKSKDTVDLCNAIFVSASFSFSVYDCVWVFSVFIPFHCKSFSRLQWCLGHTWVYGSTIMRCGHYTGSICQVLSSQFLSLSYFTSKGETPVNPQTGEKNEIICCRERWYIFDLGYKLAHQQKPTSHKKILKIRRLL